MIDRDDALIFFEEGLQQFKSNMRKYEKYDHEHELKIMLKKPILKTMTFGIKTFKMTKESIKRLYKNIQG